MLTKAIRCGFTAFLLFFPILIPLVSAQPKYPETISVLQNAYAGEIQAHLTYQAYAQKAISENYPNIAHLFVSLAASESIHARNFKQLLSDLKIEMKQAPKLEMKVSTTKENLKNATQVELQEIDQKYPQSIEKIKPDKHDEAIQKITYAWESEKQHRELIKKIESGTGMLFKMLAGIIEKTPNRYFVCQECGSTITELPKDVCPICKSPLSKYKEVERIE